MRRGRHAKRTGYKIFLVMLTLALVCTATIAGTLAWLTDRTEEVKNTFTSAELFANPATDFTLWEHEAVAGADGIYTLGTEEVRANTYDILPGVDILKDPTVDVVGLEENAYLYIKVEDNLPEGLSYTINSANWTQLDGYGDVWVYSGDEAGTDNVIVATDLAKKTFTATILTGDEITVEDNYAGTADDITLSFTAYMVQATGNGADAAEAWAHTYGE